LKNLYKTSLVLIICFVVFTTCEKYPEDGKRSWHSTEKRLTNHKWVLKEYMVNGDDSTYIEFTYYDTFISSNVTWSVIDAQLSFEKVKSTRDGKKLMATFNITNDRSASNVYKPGGILCAFNWSTTKKRINLKLTGQEHFYNIALLSKINSSDDWDIRKLTDKEFVIETIDYNNRKIRIKFIEI
jgi:hypothetical protein